VRGALASQCDHILETRAQWKSPGRWPEFLGLIIFIEDVFDEEHEQECRPRSRSRILNFTWRVRGLPVGLCEQEFRQNYAIADVLRGFRMICFDRLPECGDNGFADAPVCYPFQC
jgi:hypothetical protein